MFFYNIYCAMCEMAKNAKPVRMRSMKREGSLYGYLLDDIPGARDLGGM